MNLNHCNFPAVEQNSIVATQNMNARHAGTRIERREFEQLLQRAMEILNAGDLEAQLKTTAQISAV